MKELPAMLLRGERARLFPVLADTSKEGRSLSIFLSCFQNVDEFANALLSSVDVRRGVRSRIETFTEVVLRKDAGKPGLRPDGLILVTNGTKTWSALVEAKVGNSDLTAEQVEGYLELARLNGIDALITLSNQFSPIPSHHPVSVSATAKRRVGLFHWSWMNVVTQAALLLNNDDIADDEQRIILQEMNRFLLHPSAGVKSFDQMPAAWSDLVGKVQAGGAIAANSTEAKDVVGAWHQEVGDLSLILSRQLGADVRARMTRAHAADPAARQRAAQNRLASEACLRAAFVVPFAAAPMEICADLEKRTITVLMRLRAPDEPKTTKGKVNWLLRQLQKADPNDIHVRLFWPGRSSHTQYTLAALREDSTPASADRDGMTVLSFEVLLVKDLGARFGQRKNFISELEAAAPAFYENVGEKLKAWQPRAPKLREDKADAEDVGAKALREELEMEALAREG